MRCNDATLLQSRLAILRAVLRLFNVRFSLYARVVPKKRSGNIFVASYTYRAELLRRDTSSRRTYAVARFPRFPTSNLIIHET